jgi:hypothetical protein
MIMSPFNRSIESLMTIGLVLPLRSVVIFMEYLPAVSEWFSRFCLRSKKTTRSISYSHESGELVEMDVIQIANTAMTGKQAWMRYLTEKVIERLLSISCECG